jgi:hypothetical protein
MTDEDQKVAEVNQAMQEACLPSETISKFSRACLLQLSDGGYVDAASIKSAQRPDLERCGLLPAKVGLLLSALEKGEFHWLTEGK